jgi:hypothetical protein
MLNVNKWAEDQLNDDSDDTPLTEAERSSADNLLKTLQLMDESPTRMVNLTDTDIEVLQHGILLLKSVQDHRIDWMRRNIERDDSIRDEDIRERLDTIRNLRQMYAHLEDAKDQLPI